MSILALISAYQTSRDAFYQSGGDEFMKARRTLRADYCAAQVSEQILKEWVETLPTDVAKCEFTARFKEWESKIELGILQKKDPQTLPSDLFLQKATAFYSHYQRLLNNELFSGLCKARVILKKALLTELRTAPLEFVAKKYDITDADILYRMANEWSWKA